jgi:hypothetical protein
VTLSHQRAYPWQGKRPDFRRENGLAQGGKRLTGLSGNKGLDLGRSYMIEVTKITF